MVLVLKRIRRGISPGLKKYSGETGLSRGMIDALIDKVLIYDPEHVEIRWKFSDEVVKFIEG